MRDAALRQITSRATHVADDGRVTIDVADTGATVHVAPPAGAGRPESETPFLMTAIDLAHATLSNRVIGDNEERRMLIVDDEETIRLALSKFLRTRGYTVQTAESGGVAGPGAASAWRGA